ncbi:hypothetical protein LRS74_21650 [Streptomyces sp. LX-29]|uniref:hypothetical protein n=1 Tax=unclassified Streptomyces TaxID=2593676 RepID=UPI001184CC1D|nr:MULTISPECIES: hypothetical protein [unclassified Streptomyces]TVL87914.1 hypothetical protein CD790_32455 [Streptomyces sp. SAJ15]WFB09355.1 hypothetical protein LRS74_21650 [Streptomyces sp. LX-29]
MKKLLSAAAVAVAVTVAAVPAAEAAGSVKLVAGPFKTKAKCDVYRKGHYRGPDYKCLYYKATPDGELKKGWYIREY